VRRRRVDLLCPRVIPAWEAPFGSPVFLDLLQQKWDLFCHYGAVVDKYRSWDFDPIAATRQNTANVRAVLARLAMNGCRAIVFTGSVFEPYEGRGDPECQAFSPYGLSKHMSYELFRLESRRVEIGLRKFVIPNPFGPYEELRFTSHAVREWSEGRVPIVFSPHYIRDNIHVSLLAKAYCRFCEEAPGAPQPLPAKRIRRDAGNVRAPLCPRNRQETGRDLHFQFQEQSELTEPRARSIANPPPNWLTDGWKRRHGLN
jgi:UDP-glucose 4-epimerase